MKKGQRLWTRDELILAINLYCKLPFGKLHSKNPEIIKLSQLLGRSPGSVAFKLVNFASLDPSLRERGIKGASNSSNLDKQIWNEFYHNWEALIFESEQLIAKKVHNAISEDYSLVEEDSSREGMEREQVVRARVNQDFFRKSILAAYNFTCCVTGIQQSELLIASHIRPWGIDKNNRLNPRNGIAINALHDKAFENGLLTILPDFHIKVSSVLHKQFNNRSIAEYFIKYDNQEMILPSRFLPDSEFLKYHNQERFIP